MIKSKKALVEQNKAELEKAERELEQCYIKASINGIVLNVNAKEGSMVQQGTLLFSVGDVENLEIKGEVNEFDVVSLEPGQKVKITGDGFIDRQYSGRVKEIAPAATTRVMGRSSETTVEIVVEVLNPDRMIKPGFSANMEIITQEKKNASVMPLECIFKKNEKKYVFVVKEDNTVEEVEVDTGINNDLFVEVLKGVSKGDMVADGNGTFWFKPVCHILQLFS